MGLRAHKERLKGPPHSSDQACEGGFGGAHGTQRTREGKRTGPCAVRQAGEGGGWVGGTLQVLAEWAGQVTCTALVAQDSANTHGRVWEGVGRVDVGGQCVGARRGQGMVRECAKRSGKRKAAWSARYTAVWTLSYCLDLPQRHRYGC